ncbi:hypothetical protein [Kitasatospora sp. NPDC091207]|uniref:hypothetical protein n=1 Tax=Kitasatospora sp. NPDC091207 TaxID=3364083 RepID=UPI0038026832
MPTPDITATERTALDRILLDALDPLASAIRARANGYRVDRGRAADPAEVALAVLGTWKVVDQEVERLTAIAARTAASHGATYERLGAAWGLTRQGARAKWPDAVERPAAAPPSSRRIELFGGAAELLPDATSGGWRWSARGADGTRSADDSPALATTMEAAARAGAFPKEHSTGD